MGSECWNEEKSGLGFHKPMSLTRLWQFSLDFNEELFGFIQSLELSIYSQSRADFVNPMAAAPPPGQRRRSLGRRKIEMKLIEDDNARTVTFSKRRVGVFKKATELSILCGVQIAIIIFSFAGRAYSFGHPDVDSVISKFFNRNPPPDDEQDSSVQGTRIHGLAIRQLKEELDQKKERLMNQKRKGRELSELLRNSPQQIISEESVRLLDMPRLKKLKSELVKLKEDILQQVQEGRNTGFANAEAELTDTNKAIIETSILERIDGGGSGASTRNEVNFRNCNWVHSEADPPIPDDWLKL